MKPLKLNMSKFKKVRSDKNHTIMRHEDGHEIKIAHKALSKDMRSQLDECDSVNMYEGGEAQKPGIPGGKGSPAIDKTAAQKSDEYYKRKADHPLEDTVENAKKAFDTVTSYFYDGGEAQKKGIPGGPGSPSMDKSAAKKSDDYYNNHEHDSLEDMGNNLKKAFGYAKGGMVRQNYAEGTPDAPVQSSSEADSPDKIVQDAAAQQPAPVAPTPSININVGAPQAAPTVNPLDLLRHMVQPGQPTSSEQNDMATASPMQTNGLPPGVMPAAPQAAPEAPPQPSPQGLAAVQPGAAQVPQTGLASGLNAAATQPGAKPLDETGALAEQKAGIMAEAQAQGALGKQEAGIEQQNANAQKSIMDDFHKRQTQIDTMHDQMVQQLQAGTIDPNRYWDSKSTLGKVGTIIGLILGGGAAGYLGKDNLALETLNKNIDRDIMSQKSNLGKKENLLNANMQYLRDSSAAAAATKAMQLDYASTQLKMAGAKSQDQMAKARALQAAGPIDLLAAQYRRAATMRSAVMDLSRAAQQDPSKMNDYLTMLDMTDPAKAKEMRERAVPGVGLASVPVPQDVRGKIAASKHLDDQLTELEHFAKTNSGSLDPAVIAKGHALAAQVQDAYRQANAQGVFKESEAKFVERSINQDPTAFFAKFRSLPGYEVTKQNNRSMLKGMYSSYGLPAPNFQRDLPPQQQAFANWAKQNLNSKDPNIAKKAHMVLQKLGSN